MHVIALAVVVALSGASGQQPHRSLLDFEAIDASGSVVDLDYTGKVVLVDAWATWCAPCLEELPRLRRLAGAHRGALVVVGLSMDRMPRRDFITWLQRKDVRWPQHFDGRGYDSPAAQQLGIDAIPETWLYDRDGRLVARGLRGPTLEAAIELLLDGKVRP